MVLKEHDSKQRGWARQGSGSGSGSGAKGERKKETD